MTPAAIRAKRRRERMTPQQRTQERTFYAKRRRADLVRRLAPDLKCARCGHQAADPNELQIDHVDGKAWRAGRLSSHGRAARYWREFNAGIALRALCGSCNETDGAHRRNGRTLADVDEVPF